MKIFETEKRQIIIVLSKAQRRKFLIERGYQPANLFLVADKEDMQDLTSLLEKEKFKSHVRDF